MKLSTERFDKPCTFVIRRLSVISDVHFFSLSPTFALCVEMFVVMYMVMLHYLCMYDIMCEWFLNCRNLTSLKCQFYLLTPLSFLCLSVGIKIVAKQAHRDQHMGCYTICLYILEIIILSHTMVQAKEAAKWSCGLACECYGCLSCDGHVASIW
jgi:hypothetical protein